ncbi:hypothetical protein OG607_31490 [Streptomyces sp. NBC_01537]|uniref:hypothetical protein n=1 Tax=Streptomyces sp. NBC_01537 TaxID=2903896 RepID=UPI00386DD92B
MASTRRVRRTVLAAALAVAALTAPAVAQEPPPSPSSSATQNPVVKKGTPVTTIDRVADFYGAYIDAVYDGSRGRRLATDLRNHYFTAGLQRTLLAWERRNQADGVLRAQNAPTAWAVKYDSSGSGHLWSLVRLTWGTGTWGTGAQPTYSYFRVQSDIHTRLISDIYPIRRSSAGTAK